MGCAPELDAYTIPDSSSAFYYYSQIGVLGWMVDIGWVDINTKVSILASCLALKIEYHIESLLHFYGYLCAKHNTRLTMDQSYPDIDESQLLQCGWK